MKWRQQYVRLSAGNRNLPSSRSPGLLHAQASDFATGIEHGSVLKLVRYSLSGSTIRARVRPMASPRCRKFIIRRALMRSMNSNKNVAFARSIWRQLMFRSRLQLRLSLRHLCLSWFNDRRTPNDPIEGLDHWFIASSIMCGLNQRCGRGICPKSCKESKSCKELIEV